MRFDTASCIRLVLLLLATFMRAANTFLQVVYERIPMFSTWDQARVLASQMVHKGVNGSLASITSLAEQNFVLGSCFFSLFII
jgi:hypothetical protein